MALVVLALVRSSSFPDDVVEDRRVFRQAIIKKSSLLPPAPYLEVAYFRTSPSEFSGLDRWAGGGCRCAPSRELSLPLTKMVSLPVDKLHKLP